MEQIDRVVVCDAGPIIHLDELDCLDILDFSEILIPKTVYNEIMIHRNISWDKFNFKIVDDPFVPKELLESCKIYGLQNGEIMAIGLSVNLKNVILLTDDSAARLFATNINLQVHGTIGLLIRSIRRKLKSYQEVISILKNIKSKSTLHITQKLIDEAVHFITNKSEMDT